MYWILLKYLPISSLLKLVVYFVLFAALGVAILGLATQAGVAQETTQSQTAIEILDSNSQADFIEIAEQGVTEETTEAEYRAVVVFYRIEAMNLSSAEEEAFESYITEGQDEYGVSVAAVLQDYRQATSPDPEPPESDSDSQQGETEQDESESQDEAWDTTIKEFDNGLRIHSVEYIGEEGVAEVHVSVDPEQATGQTRFVITDGTRTETGDFNRIFGSLYPGQREVYRLDLYDVSNDHITVESGRTLWGHFGENDLSLTQDVPYPWVLSILGMCLVFVFVVAINQLNKRKSGGTKNAIKT